MTTRDKLEKVLEYIINEETDKASDLLHDVFVEKARGIYENLVTEDEITEDDILDEKKDDDEVDESKDDEVKEDKDIDEAIVRNPEQDFTNDMSHSKPVHDDIEEIESEEMYSEDGEEDEVPMDMDMEVEPEADVDGETGDPEVDQAFVDAEEALDRLKAEFMGLIGGEDEAPADEEMPMDMEPEMEPEIEGQQFESKVKDTVEEDFEEIEEAASMNSVADPSNTDTADNKKSPIAGKNDMGGTAVKVNDGSEGDHGSPSVSEDSAGNVNVPGGKAGKSQSDVSAPGNSEGADNKTSPIGS